MRNKLFLLGGVIVVAAVMAFHLRESWLTRDLTYAEVSAGFVTHDELAPAVIARTETLMTSAYAGDVSFVVPDGKRAQKGEIVARVGTQSVTAPVAGLVCARADGLEGIITPEALLEEDLAELFARCGGEEEAVFSGRTAPGAAEDAAVEGVNAAAEEGETLPARNYIQAGGSVGKIVNNLKPVWAYIALSGTEGIVKGDSLNIRVDSTLYPCTVERVDAPHRGVVVSFRQYINSATETRVKQLAWQKQPPSQGMVIPAEALFARGEEMGVYVVESGVINFRRVKVLDRNETLACVDTLQAGFAVVTNPADGLQGLAVRVRY
ncbi:MAG: hypothetical protein LBQ16_00425 [Gracilibacteraceae bacterium]|jgi:hypothetical protein|nr:hypothetical protein [Gracilibacteraceae bacterium]